MIVQGKTYKDIAITVKVTPQTLSRWIHNDPRFIVAVNAEKTERYRSNRERLQALFATALTTMEKALAKGDVKAASFIIKALLDEKAPKECTSIEQWADSKARNLQWSQMFGLSQGDDEPLTGDALALKEEIIRRWG